MASFIAHREDGNCVCQVESPILCFQIKFWFLLQSKSSHVRPVVQTYHDLRTSNQAMYVWIRISVKGVCQRENSNHISCPPHYSEEVDVEFSKEWYVYWLFRCDELVVRPVSTPTKLALFIALFSARLDLNVSYKKYQIFTSYWQWQSILMCLT